MIEISRLEVLALKKLVLINHALAKSLNDPRAQKEQRTITEVLAEITIRAQLDNETRDPVGRTQP